MMTLKRGNESPVTCFLLFLRNEGFHFAPPQNDEIAFQNQILSKRIFTQFALPTPMPPHIPPVRVPYDATTHDIAYDFGMPSTKQLAVPKEYQRRDGLDKLVAAIETLEKPYP
jgi:hypothetical protein